MAFTADIPEEILPEEETVSGGAGAIFLIWAAATVPMGILAWGVAPRLISPDAPLPGTVFWWMVVAGMAWQFVLSLIILKIEGVPFTRAALTERLWLNWPVWRPTGKRFLSAFLLVPLMIAIGWFADEVATDYFLRTSFGQSLSDYAPGFAKIENLAGPAAKGAWPLLLLAVVSSVFNYFLGEAFLFHGILLPRMEKAWGGKAWIWNGVLFAAYHVHKFWVLPGLLPGCFCYSLPAQAFRSNWLAVIIHGVEGLFLLWVITSVILHGEV